MRRVAIGSSAAGTKLRVDQLHRAVPVVRRPDGLAAVGKDRPIPSASVECYLESKFGENLEAVRPVMEQLACSSPLRELAIHAYHLYEEFRPEIPSGAPGWGAAGALDLDRDTWELMIRCQALGRFDLFNPMASSDDRSL
jgi:hypothetical protein